MFERFLHGQPSTNTQTPSQLTQSAPSAAPQVPPQPAFRPQSVMSQPAADLAPQTDETPVVSAEAAQVTETPEVAAAPQRPVMRPPMMMDQPNWPPQEAQEFEEATDEEETFAVVDEDETPETALPIEPEDDVVVPQPEMPSFLKAEEAPIEMPAPDALAEEESVVVEEKIEAVEAPVMPAAPQAPTPDITPASMASEMPEALQTLASETEEEAPMMKDRTGLFVHGDDLRTVEGTSLHEVDFADIWFTPEKVAYVRDKQTRFALTPIETPDLEDFHDVLEQGFSGQSSYAVRFEGDTYRVERVMTADGLQYNCRKMPTVTPEIETLGFETAVVKHLTSLSRASGLLLFAGPTGQGKTTTVSALMKRFLDTDGGFLYTIEDPPEMPLSGVYHSRNGGLGLCKQVPVENDQWGAGLRSALRSKPRYILVGEIRTPETASQCLVAATSGHLVLSTIHANSVEDALNSMVKYAASTGLDASLAADLLARGVLGVVHQRLEGTSKLKLVYESAFANPNPQAADQMRMAIRDGKINLSTFMEQQKTRMARGISMFRE